MLYNYRDKITEDKFLHFIIIYTALTYLGQKNVNLYSHRTANQYPQEIQLESINYN